MVCLGVEAKLTYDVFLQSGKKITDYQARFKVEISRKVGEEVSVLFSWAKGTLSPEYKFAESFYLGTNISLH